jgi:hypothetical protein
MALCCSSSSGLLRALLGQLVLQPSSIAAASHLRFSTQARNSTGAQEWDEQQYLQEYEQQQQQEEPEPAADGQQVLREVLRRTHAAEVRMRHLQGVLC